MNDGEYGSHDLQYGVEMDVPPSFDSPSEFITELHVNLANQLWDALIEQNILKPGD